MMPDLEGFFFFPSFVFHLLEDFLFILCCFISSIPIFIVLYLLSILEPRQLAMFEGLRGRRRGISPCYGTETAIVRYISTWLSSSYPLSFLDIADSS
jgi:hypothetical protein